MTCVWKALRARPVVHCALPADYWVLVTDFMPELSTRDQIVILADNFERSYPHEIVSWAALAYRDALVMATNLGPEGIVILHILQQVASRTTVFHLDTDLFFPETYRLKEALEARFGTTFVRVATDLSVGEQAA